MIRIYETFFNSSDLSCAYNQVPLTYEARQSTYPTALCGSKPVPIFFSKSKRYAFGLLNKSIKLSYTLMIPHCRVKTKMKSLLQLWSISLITEIANLKAAPVITFFILRHIEFLGHVISKNDLSSIASGNDDIKHLTY